MDSMTLRKQLRSPMVSDCCGTWNMVMERTNWVAVNYALSLGLGGRHGGRTQRCAEESS